MTREQRVAVLRAAATAKREGAEARARRALMVMTAKGASIDFASVAMEAGVSTSFLYKHESLRTEIAGRRTPPPSRVEVTSPTSSSREASNAVKLAVATSALQALRREIKVLREENARLQGDLRSLRAKQVGRH